MNRKRSRGERLGEAAKAQKRAVSLYYFIQSDRQASPLDFAGGRGRDVAGGHLDFEFIRPDYAKRRVALG